jgi:hypothetical protein
VARWPTRWPRPKARPSTTWFRSWTACAAPTICSVGPRAGSTAFRLSGRGGLLGSLSGVRG